MNEEQYVKTTCEIMQEDGMVNIWFWEGSKSLGGYILTPKALHTIMSTNEDLERIEDE